jgi:methylenetetrahydrofolate dehydrogenase (NAD+)
MEYLKVYDETLPLGNRMSGKVVVVINRSEIVGRPLAAMLANDGADVYSVDLNGVFLMRRGKMLEVLHPPPSPPHRPILARTPL